MVDPKNVGHDRPYKDAAEAHDAEHGTYVDGVDGAGGESAENRLPTANLPKAPDPSPFKLGPAAAPGGGPTAAGEGGGPTPG